MPLAQRKDSQAHSGPAWWRWTRLVAFASLLPLAAACGQSATTATHLTGATPTASTPPTLTATASPSASLIVTPTSIAQICDSALDPLPPQTITLDNRANTVAVGWDALMHKFNYGGTWEISSPSAGIVPALSTATFVFTPVANLCKEIQQAGLTLDVPLRLDVELTSGIIGGTTVIDTIHLYHP